MPRFALICTDKPGSLALRQATRPDHLAYVAAAGGAVKMAGPFLDDAGQMAGSLLIVEADDLDAARAFSADDPYARAGLFERVDIRAVGGAFTSL